MEKSCCSSNSTKSKQKPALQIKGISVCNDNKSLSSVKIKTRDESANKPYIISSISTPAGNIPVVSNSLKFCDYFGAFRMRWDMGRMNYSVKPGLYASGSPDRNSPVLVTSNYKLTFDVVRSNIGGINAWILVLDTKGINVWCAAGKGTFGTKELVSRIVTSRLSEVVDHKKIILPQLGAVGVEAYKVTKETGFSISYGPVRASDIQRYLENGMKKDREMSLVKFTFRDRLVLVPLEIVGASKAAAVIFIAGLALGVIYERGLAGRSFIEPAFMLAGLFSGAVLAPLLLPYLPVKAFSLKGAILSSAVIVALSILFYVPLLRALPLVLAGSALSAYAALQFTGASTYTSENSVRKEVSFSIPVIYTALGIGAAVTVGNLVRTAFFA